MDPQKAIAKLRRPPAVQNWVKNLRKRTDETAQSLFNTAVFGPRHSLKPVTDIIRQVVVDGIDDETAFKCAAAISNPRVRKYAREILVAILPYAREHSWKGIQIFKDLIEKYPVAANVDVPVRPTFVINDNGKVTPYFVICWAEIGLSAYQRRILTTVITDSILTLEEFEDSNAIIVCVPRYPFSKSERYVVQWNLAEYVPLTASEKAELFERYGNALAEAERMILEALS